MIRMKHLTAALFAVSLCMTAAAQRGTTDQSFKASGLSCDQIEWQPAVLEQYPNIGEACQGVVERDGRTYVKFIGFAENIDARRGTVDLRFKGSNTRVKVNVPRNTRFYIQGERVPLEEVAPRQDLTVYVPSDQFVAAFFDEKVVASEIIVAEIAPAAEPTEAQVAPSPQTRLAQAEEELPATAGPLPWFATLGGLLLLAGAGLTLVRLRRY